jgi:hypothetical protein
MLRPALRAVVDEVNARIDAIIHHLGITWDSGAPLLRIVADKV